MRSVRFPDIAAELDDIVDTTRDVVTDVEGREARASLDAFRDAGMPGLLVSEAHGGLGQPTVALALVAFELGRGAITTAVLETVLAAGIVSASAPDGDRARLLEPALEGGGVGLSVPGHRYPTHVTTAAAVLVEAGDALHLLPAGSFTAVRQPSTDPGRDPARVQYRTEDGQLVSDDVHARTRLQTWGAVAFGAYLTGLALRMTDDAADYAKVREQFGRPIGAFQAVQHRLADAFALTETAAVAVVAAAEAVDAGEFDAASAARAFCGRAASAVSVHALQVFGGIGFTEEHHLHRWLKRVKALEASFGSPHQHHDRLIARFDPRGAA